MCISFMHDFHSKTCSVENVCPSWDDFSTSVNDGLVEVETVEVKCHGADAEGGKPDAHNRPCCEEEVQRGYIST